MRLDGNSVIETWPLHFAEETLESAIVRSAVRDGDLILQVFSVGNPPNYFGERVVKAVSDTMGEAILDNFKFEDLKSDLLEGGRSIYAVGKGLGTDMAVHLIFPKFYRCLQDSMQDSEAS